jgi:putative acetyltransferase
MGAVHRPAQSDDVTDLFEIRRKAILELAPPAMPDGEAKAWAAKLTLAGMAQKLSEFEIWVAEHDGVAAGWGAIRGDVLEGLYTAPEFAGRGVGAALLECWSGGCVKRASMPSRRRRAPTPAHSIFGGAT